mgnify:CR=1 FL=1
MNERIQRPTTHVHMLLQHTHFGHTHTLGELSKTRRHGWSGRRTRLYHVIALTGTQKHDAVCLSVYGVRVVGKSGADQVGAGVPLRRT